MILLPKVANRLNMSFKYNESGIRTEKTVNGKASKYILNSDKGTYETEGTALIILLMIVIQTDIGYFVQLILALIGLLLFL